MTFYDNRPVNTKHPLFEPIWQAIKKWDISRQYPEGYAHATGTDVQVIIDSIESRPEVDGQLGLW